VLIDCTITGNTAEYTGGGVFCYSSSPVLANCAIASNSGGGVDCVNNASPTLTDCVITGNTTDHYGGGVYCSGDSSPALTNCVITGNTTAFDGGGVYCWWHANPTLTNCTMTGNSADKGGGVYCSLSSPTLANCILWDDSPQEIYVSSGSPIVAYCDIQGGWEGEGNIDADPLFVDPVNGDFHLLAGSPCIDAGDNTAVPDGVTTDLDGNPRFVDDPNTPDTGNGEPPIVDMGAYEYQVHELELYLDIKPGSCPNPLNRRSKGVLPTALVGTPEFPVDEVDQSTLLLSRADGIGGFISPLDGDHGPGIVFDDVATPFEGEPCDCHHLDGDGIVDLVMKFRVPAVVEALELGDLPVHTFVELRVSGELLDGTMFEAFDCIRLIGAR
jgi:hypothetical protein